MGFLWEGSTGARAVKLLRELEQGQGIPTPQFARMLGVRAQALHQLLANAVSLRLIKKVRGGQCIIWKIGAGNDSATIERRRPAAPALTPEELARREAAAQRRRDREAARAASEPLVRITPPDWPPRFVSTFDAAGPAYVPPRFTSADDEGAAAIPAPGDVPAWLRGLYGVAPPEIELRPAVAQPRHVQLPLFDPTEVGEGGRMKWRRLDLVLPSLAPSNEPAWRQIALIEA